MNGQLREGYRIAPGCASTPPRLLDISFEFVVVDTLHLSLRIMGLLFHQVSLQEMPFYYANAFEIYRD